MSDLHVPDILARRPWRVRPERLALVGVPATARAAALHAFAQLDAPFAQLTIEPDMITLLLPTEHWQALRSTFAHAREEAAFCVITFDIDLPAALVGFLAAISAALAAAQVPILAVCGYAKDHVIVREQHLAAALAALEALAAAQ